MSDKITVKKSTIKKLVAILGILIVLSTVSYFIYDRVIIPRIALTTNISQLQNSIVNKTQEIENLNRQITDLQNQIDNYTKTTESKNEDIVQLNQEIDTLETRLQQANQNITRLTGELYDAQNLIGALREPPIVIIK